MNHARFAFINALMLCILPVLLCGQESRAVESPGAVLLATEDIALFEPLLTNYLDAPPGVEEEQSQVVLLKAMHDFSKLKGNSSPVSDDKAWVGMFGRYHAAKFAEKKIQGAGQVITKSVVRTQAGEQYLFEYSVSLPKDYDPSKSWPVLICLHDANAKGLGSGYIKKLWLESRETDGLCERFILFAPHLPQKLPSRKVEVPIGGSTRTTLSTAKRLSWFSTAHLLAMVYPFLELRKSYNCDPKRIYIEGVGRGADAALTLAAMSPGRFAGVIARHGKLHEHRLLSGLQQVVLHQST